MIGRTIDELAAGDRAELTRPITAETIREFVDATGDDNPLHSDQAFAATTRFGQIIAPGILTGGLVSAVIGTRLPGPGTVYLSQSFRFLRPVRIGDVITARVEVTEVLRDRNRVALRTVCVNQAGEIVIEGEAWVMPSKMHIEYTEPEPARSWGFACAPATLAVQAMSFWATSGLTFAARMLELWEPRPLGS
ncbi:MAG: MaoC family dehydratase [Candidatus Rokubacteria bacterium]|nr:MaoC family dehydratase [Candidatus Rokubacteria bacterium]